MPANKAPLLEISELSIEYDTPEGVVHAVNGVNLKLMPGECLGIVGESGSGKSQTFLSVFGLLADNGKAKGSVIFQGEEILNASRARMNKLRGDKMAMIFQDSITGLTPHMSVGKQMSEVLMEHHGMSQKKAEAEVIEIMEVVQIPEAGRRFRMYPHEFSGGMRQRVMIAQALLCKPKLLIADEPTTALDVTVQAAILRLFKKLKQHTDTSIIMITHDLGVVAGLSDRVAVMYGGRLVETGNVDDIFTKPMHPYTQGLLAAIPRVDTEVDMSVDLPTILGQPPNLRKPPVGCSFEERCTHALERCANIKPPEIYLSPDHKAFCHLEVEK